ncbi:MAG: PleD family two-component system response regulator [Planctomycetota bacterium]
MSRPFSVLLVEDDDPLRSLLIDLLRQRGWQVHALSRGDEAVEVARQVSIDVTILDLHLPGLDGLEVYRRICAEIRPVPSILMSGEATREEARRALELGMVEFLRKPFDLRQLRQALDLLARRVPGNESTPSPNSLGLLPIRLEDLWPRPKRRRRP